MRSRPELSPENPLKRSFDNEALKDARFPFSGGERNRVFLNQGPSGFVDASLVSGLDSLQDTRVAVRMDLDRDGWEDVVEVAANEPLLSMHRNLLGERIEPTPGFVALRLVGGNRDRAASTEWSARDAVGARVEVRVGARTLVRELAAGSGMAAQDSATLLVGLGDARAADSIRIRWPSGKVRDLPETPSGTLLKVDERGPVQRSAWTRPTPTPAPPGPAGGPLRLERAASLAPPAWPEHPRPRLTVISTMATWCEVCRRHLPRFRTLEGAFPPGEVEVLAVPIDREDTRERLERYFRTLEPRYRLLAGRSLAEVHAVQDRVREALWADVLPASLLVAPDGAVLRVLPGVPTVSDVKAALARTADR